MAQPTRWPELSWTVPSEPLPWLIERTKSLGQRTRAFELALEGAAEAGEASLSRVALELEFWEAVTANVWMYVGLEEGKQLQPDDVPAHAEELAKVYASLVEARAAILEKLGPTEASAVGIREAGAAVDDQALIDRAGELPSFVEPTAPLAAAGPPASEAVQPVTPQEMNRRLEAEQKPLPAGADLRACLAGLPPPWVAAVFETLGLAVPQEEEDDEVELTVNSRTAIQRRSIPEGLTDALLKEVVYALEPEDRTVLSEVLSAGGAIRYSEARTRCGPDDADGYFWSERPPSGPLARLRRTGLAYVGMRDGKQVLTVPSDLLGRLSALLLTP